MKVADVVAQTGFDFDRPADVPTTSAPSAETLCTMREVIGPRLADTLTHRAGNGVEVEDLGYHPIGFTQNLQERAPYDRIVIVGAVARGRPPGWPVRCNFRQSL